VKLVSHLDVVATLRMYAAVPRLPYPSSRRVADLSTVTILLLSFIHVSEELSSFLPMSCMCQGLEMESK
jgi:hypothetical protein